jgi:hypothetical protein
MSWVRLTDTFPEDPKVDGLSDRAFRLFVTGLCYSARNLTDGYLNAKALQVVAASVGMRKTAKNRAENELETVGLWCKYGDGFWTPKYLEYNPAAEQVRAERAKAKSRMKRLRSGELTPERSGEQDDVFGGTFGRSSGVRSGTPTRPDPSKGSTVSDYPTVPVVPEPEGGDFEPEHPENEPPDLPLETVLRGMPE